MKLRIKIPAMGIDKLLSTTSEVKIFLAEIAKREDFNNGYNETFYSIIDVEELLLTCTPS